MWVEIQMRKVLSTREMGHPLREDVSWNKLSYSSVLERICHLLREDVSWNIPVVCVLRIDSCHPLREDVSWNLEEYGVNHRCSNMVLLWGGELKYPWSSFSASHEGVTIIHYLIWILNSIIEISEEIFTCVPRKNEQHLVVSLIFIWYLNAG